MYTVVVADDEEELRRALIRKVDWESVGFSVVGEAENGVEALELVEKYEPDLLLTDIRMPFVSGIELARQVREIRPATQIAFLSGYDDFSYAQQAIQYNIISYMLKPISAAELTGELRKICRKIDEKFARFAEGSGDEKGIINFLVPLMLDSFQGMADNLQGKKDIHREERLVKEAVDCGLLKNSDNEYYYTVLVTSIMDGAGENKTSQSYVHAVNMILEKYVRYVSFYIEGRIVSMLIATRSGTDKYLHIVVEEIIQSVQRIMGLSCNIGVSRSVTQLSGVHEAYMEAMNAIGYSRHHGKGVHFISDLERADYFDPERIQEYVNEVENLLRSGSRQEMESYLNNIFAELEKVPTPTFHYIMVQLVSAVLRIINAVAETDTVSHLQKNSPLYTFSGLEEMKLQRERYMEFFIQARDLIAEQRKKSSTVICDKALGIIEERYMDPDISLVTVSNEIAVSPNYLSSLIKKSTGSTFIDLLSRKRIATARELLRCSNLKIKEISEKCGYSDQHYFSYCFKKYTGMSPNACRRENEEG